MVLVLAGWMFVYCPGIKGYGYLMHKDSLSGSQFPITYSGLQEKRKDWDHHA